MFSTVVALTGGGEIVRLRGAIEGRPRVEDMISLNGSMACEEDGAPLFEIPLILLEFRSVVMSRKKLVHWGTFEISV
jgi:hypothetical protein